MEKDILCLLQTEDIQKIERGFHDQSKIEQ